MKIMFPAARRFIAGITLRAAAKTAAFASAKAAQRSLAESLARSLGPSGIHVYAVGADRSVINAAGDPIIVGTGFAEVLLKEGQGLRPQIETSCDSELIHFCCRGLTGQTW